jgi:hypothetical protein
VLIKTVFTSTAAGLQTDPKTIRLSYDYCFKITQRNLSLGSPPPPKKVQEEHVSCRLGTYVSQRMLAEKAAVFMNTGAKSVPHILLISYISITRLKLIPEFKIEWE